MNEQRKIGFFSVRVHSFVFGLSLPWVALKTILRNPSLLLLSLIPTAVTLTLYGFVIARLQDFARLKVSGFFAAEGWDIGGWGGWVALILVKLLIFLLGVVTFSFVASAVASPFNDFLAEKAERFSFPPLPKIPRSGFEGKMRLIAIDLAKSVAANLCAFAALLISWVPFLNALAFGLTFLLMAFQYVSYPQTRRGERLGRSAGFLWRHFYASLGFGASVSVLFSIPVISSLAMPLAVVGGTLLYGRAQGSPELFRLK